MRGSTKEKILRAAVCLLDRGGQGGVTLRAVAELVGVSHNAPYRHFKDRSFLLAAVAEQDFRELGEAFRTGDQMEDAAASLRGATTALIRYAREHPARYRLLFGDPEIAATGGSMEAAALAAFQAFAALVRRCQASGTFPPVETTKLTGLIYATLHGAIDLELGGRARDRKGLGDIEATVDLLFDLLRRQALSLDGWPGSEP